MGAKMSMGMRVYRLSRKIVVLVTAIAVLGAFGVSEASAARLSKGQAERAVEKRLKARYGGDWASATCRLLNRKRASCSYLFTDRGGDLCNGNARVKKYRYGLSINLGKPHEYYSPSTRCS